MEPIDSLIRQRRNLSPLFMNGQRIPDETIRELLALADWAPTHANTEPWHFTVFSGESVTRFCNDHAELYRRHTPPESFDSSKFEKLRSFQRASHLLAIALKRNPRVPEVEEIAAVACAVQTLWLAATARGIAGYWGSGGMTYHPAMREYLKLDPSDQVLGLFYLGYVDTPWPAGKRIKPWNQKMRWVGSEDSAESV